MIEIDSIRDALIEAFLKVDVIGEPTEQKFWREDAGKLADAALQVIKDWTAEEPST